jgi:hypothetical protein
MKKIVISSSWVGPIPEWVQEAINNHIKYAKKYNYTYIHHHHDSIIGSFNTSKPSDAYIKSVWQQIVDVRNLMSDSDIEWIFKTDVDSVFTNFNLDLKRFMGDDSDFIFTGDSNDVFNGGHFLVKNTSWSRDLIDLWLSFKDQIWEDFDTSHQSDTGRLSDQPVMNMILKEYKLLNKKNGHKAFNAVNGFPGNKHRSIKFFWLTHAPTARYRLYATRSLLNAEISKHVRIFPQNKFNSYPKRSPGQRGWRKGDFMIHFVGSTKTQMQDFMTNLQNFM